MYVLLIAHLREQMAKIYKGISHFYPEMLDCLYDQQESEFMSSELVNVVLSFFFEENNSKNYEGIEVIVPYRSSAFAAAHFLPVGW